MSEFNPEEQPRGFRERARVNKRTRRELLGMVTSLPPAISVSKAHTEEPQAPVKGLTRRSFLKKTALLGGVVGGTLALDTLRGVGEFIEEYENEPKNITDVIKFLEEDLQLPQDPLYGFTFPSTREIAQKYKEALLKTRDNGLRWLVIIQEKEPKSVIKKIIRTSNNPRISKPEKGEDGSVYIYIPPSMANDPPAELARWFYHEGFHLFYQPFYPPDSDEDRFNREIPTNIADILLGRLVSQRTGKEYFNIDIDRGYDQAVRENNRGLFEEELKKLYALPQDCCTYQPPENPKTKNPT